MDIKLCETATKVLDGSWHASVSESRIWKFHPL